MSISKIDIVDCASELLNSNMKKLKLSESNFNHISQNSVRKALAPITAIATVAATMCTTLKRNATTQMKVRAEYCITVQIAVVETELYIIGSRTANG